MKIILKDAAYVQKTDIKYLLKTNYKIPELAYLKICEENINENIYEFIKFVDPTDIKFFKNINWIIDYNDIKNLNEDDIIRMCKDTAEEINKIADKFNAMNDKKKEKNLDMYIKSELLDYKIHSLRDALWFKQGHINMTLPETNNYESTKSNNFIKRYLNKNKESN